MPHPTKAQLKDALPEAVYSQVEYLQKRYHTRRCAVVPQGIWSRLYLAEGYDYTVFYGGRQMSLQMVSEMSMGAAGVSYEIGKEIPMPAGAWVVAFCLSGGYPCIAVYNWGVPQLQAA